MEVLKRMFASKKLRALVAGLIVSLLEEMGLPVSEEFVMKALGLLGLYIVGQGIADIGKEAEKVKESSE